MEISSYTEYLTQNALVHPQGILAGITDRLIREMSVPFKFIELEGDAVFVFAPAAALEDGERLVAIIETSYAAFHLLHRQNFYERVRGLPTITGYLASRSV